VKSPEFLFDFGSPNAWCAHKVIPAIEARTGARFVYTPILLGGLFKLTNNRSPMIAYAEIPPKLAYEQLEMRRFIAKHKLPFTMNPFFPVNTLLIMRMATAAEMDAALAGFADAAFRFMWETPRKLDDPEIVARSLVEAGFDAERLMARALEADVKAKLISNTEAAAKRGAFGAPTFFLGEEMFFGKNTLPEIEELLREK
jgi:2-hydroxychromene-2-carboxylate isomerase